MRRHLRTTVAAIALFPLAFAAASSAGAQDLATFSVLGASTVTNTGPTTIEGNLGLFPGTDVPGQADITLGGTYYIDDPGGVAEDAQAELIGLIDDYNAIGTPIHTSDLSGQTLGVGGTAVLTPGVYFFSSSAQLNSVLTLDAQGDPNATFIIQVGSALTTASGSGVALIHGAQGSNVYWVVGTSATLGTGTNFAGQILALESISLLTAATIDCGAAWAHTGAVTMDTNTITSFCALVDDSFAEVLGPTGTPNQNAIVDSLDDYIDTVGPLPPALALLLTDLSPGELAVALDQLSGEVGAGVAPVGTQAMNSFLSLMLNAWSADSPRSAPGVVTVKALGYAEERSPRAFASFDEPSAGAGPEPRQWDMWGAVFGSQSQTDGNVTLGIHDRWGQAYGIASGFDYRISPDTSVGVALAGGSTNFGLGDDLGEGHSEMFQAGAYARTNFDPAYVAVAMAYAWHGVTTERSVIIPAISVDEDLTASFSAHNFAGEIEAGLRFGWFIPYGAVRQQVFYTPAYTETAVGGSTGDYALDYLENTTTATRTELGARIETTMAIDETARLTLRGRVAWAHDFWSDTSVMARFHSTPDMTPFVVEGATPAADSVLVSAGGEIRFAHGFGLAAWLDGEFAEGAETFAGTGRMSYSW